MSPDQDHYAPDSWEDDPGDGEPVRDPRRRFVTSCFAPAVLLFHILLFAVFRLMFHLIFDAWPGRRAASARHVCQIIPIPISRE